MRNRHSGSTFAEDDVAIARMLEDVSIPVLVLSLIHITGDVSLLEGPLRPQGLFLNEVQGYMSDEDQAAVRAMALPILATWRDAGCPEPEPLDPVLIKAMMDWLVVEEVPAEYLRMLLEEMELDGIDGRRPEALAGAGEGLRAVVIGAGESGILAGVRLAELGVAFTILEKDDGVGGTWHENRYPGARVDVGNHFYCYSFEPSDHWTEYFSQQPELEAYFVSVAERHGLFEHIKLSTEVVSAAFDEDTSCWQIEADGPEGPTTFEAELLISAVGQMNRPSIPDIPGLADFAGPAFHSARWDEGIDLEGKDVVMIGAGASGFQIAPAIAEEVSSLTVFQRTAQWMFPNPNYHAEVGEGLRWALRHLPFYGRWFRFLVFWPGCDAGLAAARVDPSWPNQQRSVSETNDLTRELFSDWIRSQVGDDEELLAKVLPDYPPTGKRTLQDNGSWLRALTRENVELVRCGIDRVVPDGVVDADGVHHRADLIVLATGFEVTKMLAPMRITGRGGVDLHERWGRRPAAHLGITVPGFPNLFLLYGPGTNLVHGGSLIFHSECQMRYISGCIAALARSGVKTMEVREEPCRTWHERSQAELAGLVWSQPSIKHSYFKNEAGEIHVLSPWRLVDYWAWTREPDISDFEMR